MTMISIMTVGVAIGCGLAGGVFFAFSTFVMPALARLPPSQGIAAMQSINVMAINGWFLGALFGTALGCAVLAVASLRAWSEPGAALRLGGSALYLLGAIAVTIGCNVPRNEAFSAVRPESAESARQWLQYVTEWTNWNHVRALAAIAAAALLGVSLLSSRSPG